uniref:Serine carboxypeptidase lysosomal cathepsin a n=1 Tax=Amblyomma parvum TaxID=251391 RepID=A0A023G0P1_AMBPA
MNTIFLLLFVIWTVLFTTRHVTRRKATLTEEERRKFDEPLFLTPLLESNDTAQARRLSRVTLFEEYGVEAHSGYVTVNKGYGSHLFFLLAKAKHLPDTAPLILWTFGGPGVSSLIGPLLFNGPVVIDSLGRLNAAPGEHLQRLRTSCTWTTPWAAATASPSTTKTTGLSPRVWTMPSMAWTSYCASSRCCSRSSVATSSTLPESRIRRGTPSASPTGTT